MHGLTLLARIDAAFPLVCPMCGAKLRSIDLLIDPAATPDQPAPRRSGQVEARLLCSARRVVALDLPSVAMRREAW